jgi:hypothetical protein
MFLRNAAAWYQVLMMTSQSDMTLLRHYAEHNGLHQTRAAVVRFMLRVFRIRMVSDQTTAGACALANDWLRGRASSADLALEATLLWERVERQENPYDISTDQHALVRSCIALLNPGESVDGLYVTLDLFMHITSRFHPEITNLARTALLEELAVVGGGRLSGQHQ